MNKITYNFYHPDLDLRYNVAFIRLYASFYNHSNSFGYHLIADARTDRVTFRRGHLVFGCMEFNSIYKNRELSHCGDIGTGRYMWKEAIKHGFIRAHGTIGREQYNNIVEEGNLLEVG